MPWETDQETAREAAENLAQSSQVNPLSICDNAWGMFSWADASPAAGGGIGAFQWFDTRDNLLEFLTDSTILMWKDFESKDEYESFCYSLKKAAGEDPEGKVALEAINKIVRGLFQVEWIGQFQELLSSDSEFATKVRDFYHANDDEDRISTGSIEADAIGEFAESLGQYGL